MPPARTRALLVLLCACGNSHSTGFSSSDEAPSDAAAMSDDGVPPASSGDGGSVGEVFPSSDGAASIMTSPVSDAGIVLPANFVMTEHGGYALGPPILGDGAD